MQSMALSLNRAAQSVPQDMDIKDVAAFVILGLQEIVDSVDQTASAWEKRDYWLKADKFRLEWIWAEHNLRQIAHALESEEWGEMTVAFGDLAGNLSDIKIPKKIMDTRPWVGAFEVWKRQTS
jgi:hypothetical protein